MVLLVFWVKIFFKRIVEFFKQSPIIFIWLVILVFAFIIGGKNINLTANTDILVFSIVFLAISSILISLKYYDVIPVLVLYSKSCLNNKCITIWYFIKKTIRNNLLLIILANISIYQLFQNEYFTEILQIIIIYNFSLFLSFFIMYFKYKFTRKRILKLMKVKYKINPHTKSTVFDYFTGDLILMIILGIALFIFLLIELMSNFQALIDFDYIQPIRVGIIIILVFGFSGIIDSIPNINWKFYSIINPKSFLYYVKKSSLILICSFLPLLILLGIITSFFGLIDLFKYLCTLLVIMVFSIFNAFSYSNIITAIIKVTLFTVFTIWISTLHFWFYLLLTIPLLIIGFTAKIDYKERYYL